MSEANQKQVGGEHYKASTQHWDLMSKFAVPYLPAQVTRYLSRWRKKNGIEDLEKALHYTNKAHEEFLKRQNEIIAGVAEFAQANDLTEQERMAVEAMFRFHQGDQHWLITGRGIIEHMIAAENERKQQQAHAAQQQIDEAMETKENLNA